jgi:hypothetical protein
MPHLQPTGDIEFISDDAPLCAGALFYFVQLTKTGCAWVVNIRDLGKLVAEVNVGHGSPVRVIKSKDDGFDEPTEDAACGWRSWVVNSDSVTD